VVHLEADQVVILVLESADLGQPVEEVLLWRVKVPAAFFAAAAVSSWAVAAAACVDYSPLHSAAAWTISVNIEWESFEHC
jgi:hypothetical protein